MMDTFSIVLLIILVAQVSLPASSISLGLIWDRSLLADINPLLTSLNVMGDINGAAVDVRLLEVSQMTPYQISNKVCEELSTGVTAFISMTGCYKTSTIASYIKDLNVPFISVSAGCDISGAPWRPPYMYSLPRDNYDISSPMSDLLKDIGWKNIPLIYTDNMHVKVDTIMPAIAKSNATVQTLRIRASDVQTDVAAILDYLNDNTAPPRTVLVVCDALCMLQILHQVQEYSRVHDVQEVFTFRDQWLFVADTEWVSEIERHIQHIDNIAVLTQSDTLTKSSESLVEEAFSYLLRAVSANFTLRGEEPQLTTSKACSPPANTKLRYQIATELQEYMEATMCGNCSMYEVRTAVYTTSGPRLTTAATWSKKGLHKQMQNIFPNLNFGLNNRHMDIVTNIWSPFVMKDENTTVGYKGLCVQIIQELAKNLNFTLSEPVDGGWGTLSNGTWNGLVGVMQRKEADLMVAPLYKTVYREQVMDFTSEAFFQEYYTILAKMPDPEAAKWNLYISPFKWSVWLLIMASIPCAGLLIWAITALSPFYAAKGLQNGLQRLDHAMLYALGAIFSQGGTHLPEAQSGRFIVGFWWMYCIVVVATYSGNLIAFLTVTKSELAFDTLEQLVGDTSVAYGTLTGTALITFLQNSEDNLYSEAWKGILGYNKTDPEVLSSDHYALVQKVLDGSFAYIGDRTSFEVAMSKHCDLEMVKYEFFPNQYAVGLQNNSAFMPVLSNGISKIIEGGLVAKWKQEWWPRPTFCSRGLITEAKAVTLKDVQGAYYALGILIFIAAIILCAEYILSRVILYHRSRSSVDNSKTNGLNNDAYPSVRPSIFNRYDDVSSLTTSVSDVTETDHAKKYENESHTDFEYDIFGRQLFKRDNYDLFGRPMIAHISKGKL